MKSNCTHKAFFIWITAYLSCMLIVCAQYPVDAQEKSLPSLQKEAGQYIPDWQARWELARVLSYVKQYDESLREYKKLLQEKPNLYEAKIEMAYVLFYQGKREEALTILENIPNMHINDKTMVTMADLYTAQKQYQKAEPLYRVYLQKHPDDQKVRFKLAQMLSWQKKYDASIAEYRIILDRIPDDIQVRRHYAFVLIWAGKHAEAATELRKTLK